MNVELLKNNQVNVEEALGLWGDMDSYNEALREFRDSLAGKVLQLEEFMNQGDWSNYAILAHSIKSESKYLGFMTYAEVFYEHELKGKANDGFFIQNNFKHLKDTVNVMVSLMNSYFGEKRNLLIADDSNIILNFLEKSITDEFNILKATNGEEALLKIQENQVYAILLDLNMPGMDGFSVLEYLKERGLTEQIPVIVITGDESEESIQKAFSYRILDVLNKPFNESNIRSVLEKVEQFYNKN